MHSRHSLLKEMSFLQDVVMGKVLIVSVYIFRVSDDRDVTIEQERDRGQHCNCRF